MVHLTSLYKVAADNLDYTFQINCFQKTETVSKRIGYCFQIMETVSKELDIVSKRWKHLETFPENEGVSKIE